MEGVVVELSHYTFYSVIFNRIKVPLNPFARSVLPILSWYVIVVENLSSYSSCMWKLGGRCRVGKEKEPSLFHALLGEVSAASSVACMRDAYN